MSFINIYNVDGVTGITAFKKINPFLSPPNSGFEPEGPLSCELSMLPLHHRAASVIEKSIY